MELEEIACAENDISKKGFWKAITIWLNNPHVVDRRILTSIKLLAIQIKDDPIDTLIHITKLKDIVKLFEKDTEEDLKIFLTQINCIDHYDLHKIADPLESECLGNYLCITKLLPRNSHVFSPTIQFAVINKIQSNIFYFHKQIIDNKQLLGLNKFYGICYDASKSISIKAQKSTCKNDDLSTEWLRSKLLPRLVKWAKNELPQNELTTGSLTLISSEKYVELYNKLKDKYGTEMVKTWPENTDPSKFVYEDVAIATYLLLLWEKERKEKNMTELQSFVDIGCGNGLLVYILSSEGHRGMGIDLRKRKIWDLYPQNVSLEVRTIVPSSANLFPDVDWLIGNHSDELTPWIPVIAARSSFTCRFFLLPCCSYEFDGSKYQRSSTSRSQYLDYMYYVQDICVKCGFETFIDRLRIPSTKRTCMIGWQRNYTEENIEVQDKIIQSVIKARSVTQDKTTDENIKENEKLWSSDFTPRATTEKVRNCTQLDKELIKNIVNIVSSHLLHKTRRISVEENSNETWNAGGQIELCEIAKIIPSELLKQLRNECGGLQTLIKNKSHIFEIAQGRIQFRTPGSERSNKKKNNDIKRSIKTKLCWFYENHPDGCPISDEKCNFIHQK